MGDYQPFTIELRPSVVATCTERQRTAGSVKCPALALVLVVLVILLYEYNHAVGNNVAQSIRGSADRRVWLPGKIKMTRTLLVPGNNRTFFCHVRISGFEGLQCDFEQTTKVEILISP